ncbi:hypothetical protein NA57DRAFT_73272 [Rhizodiscina lignyota]|uniref:Polyprenal reductase n=1 Tax=Rhizodiscina lignyota TaxID=1504668 RepID=A0A9P4MBW3_9PEZI|nr:hypothetical protein NA57DRAFT_73272 [Rhizodiscina lignyota]
MPDSSIAMLDSMTAAVDAVVVLRSIFILSAATVLFVYNVPAFRNRFLAYGARATSDPKNDPEKPASNGGERNGGGFSAFLDYFSTLTVPRSWFTHFYVASVASNLFWLYVIWTNSLPFRLLAESVDPARPSMDKMQIVILQMMMALQGCRRLYECVAFRTNSDSRMWVGHYIMGMLFYLAVGVGVWIEGSPCLLGRRPELSFAHRSWFLAAFICTGVLAIRSMWLQHKLHRYLYNLRTRPRGQANSNVAQPKYSLPDYGPFKATFTPHYLVEMSTYGYLTFMAAPEGHWANKTLSCALVLVVVNLGVTAIETREWYAKRFGEEAVKDRRVFPLLGLF